MKKRSWIPMVVFLTCFPLAAQTGQNTAAQDQTSSARNASKKTTSISVKVGSEGKTFTADKGNRIQMRLQLLRGLDGQQPRGAKRYQWTPRKSKGAR